MELEGARVTINAKAPHEQVRAELLDEHGRAMPGFSLADWITFWVEHLRTKVIRASQLCLLLRDEPQPGSKSERVIIGNARVIREVQPEVQIWNNPGGDETAPYKISPELYKLSTILCAHRDQWMRNRSAYEEVWLAQQKAGRALAFYQCSGPVRALGPYAYYRLQAWECFRYGAIQSFFWTLRTGDAAYSWNEYARTALRRELHTGWVFAPQFRGRDGWTPSKQMEANREGLYDYEYLMMLKDAVEVADRAGRTDPPIQQARALLKEGSRRVLEAVPVRNAKGEEGIDWRVSKDRTIADQVRLEILGILESLQITR